VADEDEDELDGVVVVVDESDDEVAAAPPQAASNVPAMAMASTAPSEERTLERCLIDSIIFFTATVWRANLDVG
jgi:hypothetical protein